MNVPPDAVRDVLEGVMRLMGQTDVSWKGIKAFLGGRGVKEGGGRPGGGGREKGEEEESG